MSFLVEYVKGKSISEDIHDLVAKAKEIDEINKEQKISLSDFFAQKRTEAEDYKPRKKRKSG